MTIRSFGLASSTLTLIWAALVIGGPVSTALADDGVVFRRQTSSPPGETQDPEPEGEHAFIKLMNFRVPAQTASGDLTEIDYLTVDGGANDVEGVTTAKPLINVFVYGPVIAFDDFSQSGFPGHGRREAFGAVSLDDGATWKRTNLSNSADKSSFEIGIPIPDPGWPSDDFEVTTETEYLVTFALLEKTNKLTVSGEEAEPKGEVDIRNAQTKEVILSVKAASDGTFELQAKKVDSVPCYVQAGREADGIWGPEVEVEGADPATCDSAPLITDYPGDVTNIFHAVAGNKVLVAWQSKFCQAGFPGYVGGSIGDPDAVAAYLGINRAADLYLEDLFRVGGSQLSVDYREQEEFPGEYADVGEVPYNCLWSARGVLRENPEAEGTTEVVWFQAERLTSGRRDVNRIETSCVAGGGCAITWQEDPKGLRPGEGEGAGTGWAGATTNSKTDVWYSFIAWEDLDIVNLDGAPVPLADNILTTGRPQPYVPMAVPVRLTNNERCASGADPNATPAPYCNELIAGPYGIKNQCVDTVRVPLGKKGVQEICVVDANDSGALDYGDLPNLANTAASRPRLNLQPRDSDGDGLTDDAWVIVIHEEDKGLGRFGFLNTEPWDGSLESTGVPCGDPDTSSDPSCVKADIGKNQWYISFALGGPDTSAGLADEFGLVNNLVAQHNQYNAPEVNWITGTFYPPNSTADMWDFGDDLNYLIFNTEIARRASLMSQPLGKALDSQSRLVAMPLFKEGIINQGGPADIMARRIVLPGEALDPFDEQTANPYAFENLECAWYDGEGTVLPGELLFAPGSGEENPYYPKGLCTAPSINLSARTPLTCEASGTSDGVCPGAADMTCTDDARFGQLCLSTTDPLNNQTLDKLLTWYECPGSIGTSLGTGATMPACYQEPDSQLLMANLDDRSWYNPMDISKAHRGFLDGDFVFMLYAWSPNWKLNAVGRDRYELYTRRSFNGGVSWTTTPSSFVASDGLTYGGAGTTTCETWRDGADSTTDSHVCTQYVAGVPEQSRNVTQHKSMRVTTLDPRYTPTLASMPTEGEWALFEPLLPTDVRNPSRNFVVFETGDNTTVAEGEAEPLNLDYGRAILFGDHFQVWAEENDLSVCYPNDTKGDETVSWAAGTGFCNEFDTLEGFPLSLSEEASVTSSAAGDFLYGTWGQFNVDENGEFIDGDVLFRRVWYLDGYIPSDAWQIPGDAQ
jgi:hypothetical protein